MNPIVSTSSFQIRLLYKNDLEFIRAFFFSLSFVERLLNTQLLFFKVCFLFYFFKKSIKLKKFFYILIDSNDIILFLNGCMTFKQIYYFFFKMLLLGEIFFSCKFTKHTMQTANKIPMFFCKQIGNRFEQRENRKFFY